MGRDKMETRSLAVKTSVVILRVKKRLRELLSFFPPSFLEWKILHSNPLWIIADRTRVVY